MDVKDLPKTISVDVEYYNSTEKGKLENYSSADLIKKVAGRAIEVPTVDFLTYYIFYKKTPGKDGFSNFDELSDKFSHALSDLDGYFSFDADSLRTNEGENFRNTAVSERIGEAIGISVVNKIHGLTRADWNKIDEIRGTSAKKTFDYEYEIGSDGKNIIHIENKGSLVDDNSRKCTNISKHKSNIVNKKVKIRADKAYPYPSDIMYGTIGAIDSETKRNAKCWLLDPEPEEIDIDPLKLRLLNRYDYLLSIIRMISPRSQLTTALTTRFYDLAAIMDFKALDGLPVRMANGEKFSHYDGEYVSSPLYAGNKSRLSKGNSIGKVVAYGEEQLLYLGIDMDVVNTLVTQDFEKIIQYSNKQRIHMDSVRCSFGVTQRRQLSNQLESYFGYDQTVLEKKKDYVFYEANANVVSFQEGLLFAVLENNSDR